MKLTLKSLQGKMTRNEMKTVMAGCGGGGTAFYQCCDGPNCSICTNGTYCSKGTLTYCNCC